MYISLPTLGPISAVSRYYTNSCHFKLASDKFLMTGEHVCLLVNIAMIETEQTEWGLACIVCWLSATLSTFMTHHTHSPMKYLFKILE